MINDEVPDIHPIQRLVRQVERASLFTHTALSENAEATREVASMTFALVDLLTDKGLISEMEVLGSARAVRDEMAARGEDSAPGVAFRVDPRVDPDDEEVFVNCEERIPVCKAICCKLWFPLTVEEVEAGDVKWDLGMPYHIRQEETGFCTHLRDEPRGCGVYTDRPAICRRYTCADDERIWKDFDGMVLNEEWINEHLAGTTHRLVEAQMIVAPTLASDDTVRQSGDDDSVGR